MKHLTLETLLSESRQFANIEFLSKQVVEGFITGLHKSPFHGFSVEFAEHRQYNTGESTKHIDWKVFAKSDKLYIKRYEEETNLRCSILLDTSPSMYYPNPQNDKLKFGILAAASIVQMLQKQRDAVQISTFDSSISYQSQMRSTGAHANELIQNLEKIYTQTPVQNKSNIAAVLHQIAEITHRRSLIIIISDFFENITDSEAIFDAFKHLKHNKHEILAFHIKDKKTEQLLDFADRNTVFIDSETGEKIKTNPKNIRNEYVEIMKNFNETIQMKARQYKIDFLDVDSADDFRHILLPFLIKRSKMI